MTMAFSSSVALVSSNHRVPPPSRLMLPAVPSPPRVEPEAAVNAELAIEPVRFNRPAVRVVAMVVQAPLW